MILIINFLAIISYCLIYLNLLPNFVILRSDDFGYVDSIIKTISNAVFSISDWIEPFNFFSTLTSASFYKITGNFYLSTYGLLFIFSVINFTLLLFIAQKAFNPLKGTVLTLFITTSLIYLDNSLDLTGVLPTWVLFTLSLLSWKYKYYLLFIIFSFFAISKNCIRTQLSFRIWRKK